MNRKICTILKSITVGANYTFRRDVALFYNAFVRYFIRRWWPHIERRYLTVNIPSSTYVWLTTIRVCHSCITSRSIGGMCHT